MLPDQLRSALVGPIAFPVTPFNADLSLDLPGLARNVRALLEHPPAAVVAAGGTGELYSLTPTEHLRRGEDGCRGMPRARAGHRRRRIQCRDRSRSRA